MTQEKETGGKKCRPIRDLNPSPEGVCERSSIPVQDQRCEN